MTDIKSVIMKNKPMAIIIVTALVGVLLMVSSPSGKSDGENTFSDCAQYAERIEKKIASSLEDMCGGRVDVIVTVEACEQYVYAKNENATAEKNGDNEKTSVSDEYAEFNGAPLITTVIQPKISGIGVICRGGDDPVLQNKIINLLSCAYSISSAKIYVSGI